MQNKNILIGGGLVVVLIALAAFIGARLINNNVDALSPMGLSGEGDQVSVSIQVQNATELPTLPPEIMGLFISREDNTIIVQSMPLDMGGGVAAGSPLDTSSGPKVEVVITAETIIYKETTQLGEPPSGEQTTVQQTVAKGTLDDLNVQSMATVWGRRSGDRVIAEILLYSNPVMIQAP